jgi:calcineurin-like phosphoesterase family protein
MKGKALFLWSDTHFNHAGILRYCSRPYGTVKEMNRALIERWNSVVGPKDTVWHLGDFGFPPRPGEGDELPYLFGALNGQKNLVVGNHDQKNKVVLRLGWNEMEMLTEVKHLGARATLCHYPLETWPASWHGTMMLHGHCHGTLRRKVPKRFDVGADVEQVPVRWEDLVERASRETFVPVDGHGTSPQGGDGEED